jgi:hypothetical protein
MANLGCHKYYFHKGKFDDKYIQLLRYDPATDNSDTLVIRVPEEMPESIDALLAEHRPQSFLDILHQELKLFLKGEN